MLEDEYRLGAAPEAVKELLEWNFISNPRKFVDLLKRVIDLLLVLFNTNILRFFKGIKVV